MSIKTETIIINDMTLLNDRQIRALAEQGMIHPFEPELIRKEGDRRVLSYGQSSFGYDIRLSPVEFFTFKSDGFWRSLLDLFPPRQLPEIDPKNFDKSLLESVDLRADQNGNYFLLPPWGFGLGVALERLKMPASVWALCSGKSTIARCGVSALVTPAEPGWEGHLTLEFFNCTPYPVRLYANEGVLQLAFFEGDRCDTSYSSRNGKYQDQPERVILPRV